MLCLLSSQCLYLVLWQLYTSRPHKKYCQAVATDFAAAAAATAAAAAAAAAVAAVAAAAAIAAAAAATAAAAAATATATAHFNRPWPLTATY